MVTLSVIRDSASFNQTTRDQTNDLVGKSLQFDTVLTAFLYNRIFSITSPLSEYLQTRGIDLLQAWRMVESSTNCSQRISRDFYTIHDRAVKFCNGVNRILSLQASEDQEIEVSTSFPNKRVRRRKAHADEERDEDVISSPLERYRVEVFCAVMDEVVGSLRRRFLQQGDLYRDFAFLNPRRFAEFRNKEIPTNVLSKLCNISGLNIDREVVKEQLVSFFDAFPRHCHCLRHCLMNMKEISLANILKMKKHQKMKLRMTKMGAIWLQVLNQPIRNKILTQIQMSMLQRREMIAATEIPANPASRAFLRSCTNLVCIAQPTQSFTVYTST